MREDERTLRARELARASAERRSQIPPRPTSQPELLAAIDALGYVPRRRTIRQLYRQHRAWLLRQIEDKSIAEIARILRVGRAVVYSDLEHERRRIRTGIEQPLAERVFSYKRLLRWLDAWDVRPGDIVIWARSLPSESETTLDLERSGPLDK